MGVLTMSNPGNATFATVLRLHDEVEHARSKEEYERKADEVSAAIEAVLDNGTEDDKFRVLAFLAAEHCDQDRARLLLGFR